MKKLLEKKSWNCKTTDMLGESLNITRLLVSIKQPSIKVPRILRAVEVSKLVVSRKKKIIHALGKRRKQTKTVQ